MRKVKREILVKKGEKGDTGEKGEKGDMAVIDYDIIAETLKIIQENEEYEKLNNFPNGEFTYCFDLETLSITNMCIVPTYDKKKVYNRFIIMTIIIFLTLLVIIYILTQVRWLFNKKI